MKSGALVFLAAFLALAASWGGFVLAPQIQLGRNVQTNAVGTSNLYPQARPGLARQGMDVYRANGCVYCHSQQIGQDGSLCEIVLTDAGTNATATHAAIARFYPDLAKVSDVVLLSRLRKSNLKVADMNSAKPLLTALDDVGAKAEVRLTALGPDIERGWGQRRTVAQDYLFDYPVQLGSLRIGPDLANVGARRLDADWQLRHLYAPRSEVQDSTMPPYRFLFEKRKVGAKPSPDALQLSGDFAPPKGYEIVPKPEAIALAAYLLSLRADAPLFEAPLTTASMSPAETNTPAK
jgi:cbb3-type cytochrome oxidase cytochrome c subunit